ncbi:NAD(P)-binding domain-containing protein [Cutibacterium equinum]|uniref:NAD(P)-binding domain-containing protein n=1 Tax=Cutibacterium equinum TaxID=3016342 RepID=A0ABY7R2W4_9ACTN|nr:NAD(P)-binding domain-containing protein [Cutibacterium equinum]WCC81047.1 NAD(P)-binding domain-containing protein [Cutibacterium equinum]
MIGAGQSGLATSYHLTARDIGHLVLDANPRPGGAWQHRWDSLTMRDVHGVADLPGDPAPPRSPARANDVIPRYFAGYEQRHELPVLHSVMVERVVDDGGLLRVDAGDRTWFARTLVNATGTWTRPFVPFYPGIDEFAGRQFHTATYPGLQALRGQRVLVVGGGNSAVQFIGELAPVTDVVWVTRRPPLWRDDERIDGLAAVTKVEERVVAGLPPQSVVSVTGLVLREQEQRARELGAYDRRLPMFDHIESDGVRWADGRFEPVDVILWATGFRPALEHLARLHLRNEHGGITLQPVRGNVQGATTSAVDPRIHFVGYGPSASTIGATKAGRTAAVAVQRYLREHDADIGLLPA